MPEHRRRGAALPVERAAPGFPDGTVGGPALLGDDCPVRVLHPEALTRAQATLRSDADYADLAETFRALGDASRAKLLHALLSGELCVCDLAALIGISESAISQHLRVLRGLRIVRNRKAGRVVYYSLEDACIRALLAIALTHLDDPAGALPPPPPRLVPVPLAQPRPGARRARRRLPSQRTASDDLLPARARPAAKGQDD